MLTSGWNDCKLIIETRLTFKIGGRIHEYEDERNYHDWTYGGINLYSGTTFPAAAV